MATSKNKIIGWYIKERRLSLNMSQESLCKGICAISYLSKIEKGIVIPNVEIMEQLCSACEVEFIEDIPWSLEEKVKNIFYDLVVEKRNVDETKEEMIALTKYRYSELGLYILMLEMLHIEEVKLLQEKLDRYKELEEYVPKEQLYEYYMTFGITLGNLEYKNIDVIKYFKKAYLANPLGFAEFHLGKYYFFRGEYHASIKNLESTYRIAMECGDIDCAVDSCNMIALCYCNLEIMSLAEQYFEKIMRMRPNNKTLLRHVQYNHGASLIFSHPQKACYLLKELYDESKMYDATEKYILALLEDNQQSEAYKCFKEYKELREQNNSRNEKEDNYSQHIFQMIEMMVTNPRHLSEAVYGQTLSILYERGENYRHFGFKKFYGQYYIRWLKYNRYYKKALEVTEEIYFIKTR